MKTLFTVTAVLTLLLGVGWVFAPDAMFAVWNVQGDPLASYMGQRYGAMFSGYSVLMWMSRGIERTPAAGPILAGGAVVTAAMTIVSLVGVLGGTAGPGMWGAVVVEAGLAIGFVRQYLAVGRATR